MWTLSVFLIFLYSPPPLFVAAASQDEVAGLFAVYNSAGGIDWTWPGDNTGHRRTQTIQPDTGTSNSDVKVPWNFTTDEAGSFLENPCSPSTGSGWQGVECSNSSTFCSTVASPTTPCTIVSLNLMLFYNLKGPLAANISKLSGLQHLNLAGNKLSGTLPSSLGLLTALTYIFLAFNEFTGTIPPTLGGLNDLARLSIRTNSLTGPLPSELGSLNTLTTFDFEQNLLSGFLPSELGELSSVEFFDCEYNFISGPIPSTFGKLKKVKILDLDSTAISGTIPPELGDAVSLQFLLLFDSDITGSLPASLGSIQGLMQLDVHGNLLTGPIPPSLGNNTELTYLSLGKNFLTGGFPSTLSSLTNMELLSFSQNKLKGHIPSFIGNYPVLQKFFLQGNQFSGQIEDIFNVELQRELVHVDMSDNLITGHLPARLFQLVNLKTAALSGGFDERLCAASGAKTLSLDGLGASDGCDSTLYMPFTGVKVLNTWVGGSIPKCLWSFENLTSLHLTGNILSGTIGDLSAASLLVELSLSHNLLSGTIPTSAQNIQSLDLSYNKLTGEFDNHIPYTNESAVILEINRLSGGLPVELNSAETVKVLHGNMFNCDYEPRDDNVHNHDYVCGSSIFDISLLFWFCVVFGCCAMLTILMITPSAFFKARLHAVAPTLHLRALKQHLYLTFFDTFSNKFFLKNEKFQVISKFTRYLNETGTLFLGLSGLLIFSSLPVCFMKMFGGTQFSKYEHDYMWVWCLTHLHGIAPAVLIIIAWTVVLVMCLFWFPKHYDVSKGQISDYVMTRANVCLVLSMFVLNALVVGFVNAMYIASQHHEFSGTTQFMIKMMMAAFTYITNVIFTPMLCMSIKEPSRNVSLRLRIFIFNNIFIPCMVTFFTSRSCFQDVIEEAHPVSSTYSFELCTLFIYSEGSRECVEHTTTLVEVAPMIPLFYYKYECSSEILTSFIPVYLMVAAMQLLLPFAFVMIFTKLPYEFMPVPLRPLIHGIIWPKYWIAVSNIKKADLLEAPLLLLDTVDILSMDIVFNLSIMLTFGFCSPILALAIGCSCFFKIKMWTLFIGRLMSYFTKQSRQMSVTFLPRDFKDKEKIEDEREKEKEKEKEDEEFGAERVAESEEDTEDFPYTLSALATTCIPIYSILDKNMVVILRSSSVFLSMLVWDVAADDLGWKAALWAPISLLLITTVLVFVSSLRRMDQDESSDGEDNDLDRDNNIELKSRVNCSPSDGESRYIGWGGGGGGGDSSVGGSSMVVNPIFQSEE